MTPQAIAALIHAKASANGRLIIAIAGPPGSGKSTLADAVVSALGAGAKAVPMDGFHYDDSILLSRGARGRKGAPDTFDVHGFLHMLERLRKGGEVAIPLFDRTLEISRAAADIIAPDDRLLVIEGNYLLFNETPWDQAAPLFDLTIWIDVADAELDRRLLERWAYFGKTPAEARVWIDNNDMPNIRRVKQGSRGADIIVKGPAP